jgi:polar amino acid transport system substrate-binding protein
MINHPIAVAVARWERACRKLCTALGVWASLFMAATAYAAAPVRLATHDQAPYGTYLSDKTFDGIAVRVVRCVFKRLQRPVEIDVYPWERAQLLAQKGEVDGFFPATLKPERLAWAQASVVIADQKWVWYLPAGSKLDPMSPEFKATAKVGAHFGSNRLKMLEAEKFNVVLQPQTDELLLQAFMSGRADAILGGDQAIALAMKNQNVNPKAFKMVVAQDSPLHAYFGSKFLQTDPEFVERFNAQVPACR